MSNNQTPTHNLAIIAQHYLNDTTAIEQARTSGASRRASIPQIQAIVQPFIEGKTTLEIMRHDLDVFLRQPAHNTWGTTGFWMMTLNQLTTYHGAEGAEFLRETLDGLDYTNVGERFEAFGKFLQTEKQRLDLGQKLAAPGKSPYFITLFARWLDAVHDPLVAWPSLRQGLKVLVDHNALPYKENLHITSEVEITNAADYHAVVKAIDAIERAIPSLTTTSDYWSERFLAWVNDHKQQISIWLKGGTVALTFPDEPLLAIEPRILNERVQKLRRELLISEFTIKRIYRALVLGQHVILSGPPGTGKTQLATLLPKILWMEETSIGSAPSFSPSSESHLNHVLTTITSYTVQIATATDEWTPRHVIGGIVPELDESGDQIRYHIAPGYLTETILQNWAVDPDDPRTWVHPQRQRVTDNKNGILKEYRGSWLVIDEFNRAPIDLALGEALTAIGGNQVTLTVPTRSGPQKLPLPQDFRIIGTLNTFDRHFLNQVSEALKRRFVFIEVLPPSRHERRAEQGTVLYKALIHMPAVAWGSLDDIVQVVVGQDTTPWLIEWKNNDSVVRHLFDEGWRLFEVIRIYRQFGTAQAIAWCTAFLGAGLLQQLAMDDEDGWRTCLDMAFADTIADQLQILFPDEIDVILAYLRSSDIDDFAKAYEIVLNNVVSLKRRTAQIMALQSIKDPTNGHSYLSSSEARILVDDEQSVVPRVVLNELFHTEYHGRLLDFEGRLERFLFERMI